MLGVIYGLIFGIMDLEDLSRNYLKAAFVKEQNYCIPIGLGFGCITGYMNEYIRNEVFFLFCDFFNFLIFIYLKYLNEYYPLEYNNDEEI